MGIIGFLILGLIAGAIAKAILPGRQGGTQRAFGRRKSAFGGFPDHSNRIPGLLTGLESSPSAVGSGNF